MKHRSNSKRLHGAVSLKTVFFNVSLDGMSPGGASGCTFRIRRNRAYHCTASVGMMGADPARGTSET
jgi:hypothetical protein